MGKQSTPANDETPPEGEKLTAKEEAFVERYLIHHNATRAAKEAGYSEKTAHVQGCRLLKNVKVSSRVRARLTELQMDANEVHERLSDHARVDMTDFLTIHEEIPPLWSPEAKYRRKDLVSWGSKCYRAIADCRGIDPDEDEDGFYWEEVPPRRFADLDLVKAIEAGKGHLVHKAGYNKAGQLEIELVDSQSALVQVGRIHKMFTDKVETNLDEEAQTAIESVGSKLDNLAEQLKQSQAASSEAEQ